MHEQEQVVPNYKAEAAQILRDSKKRMNDGGKHWIKYALSRPVRIVRRGKTVMETGYCMIGGIVATEPLDSPARKLALRALATAILADRSRPRNSNTRNRLRVKDGVVEQSKRERSFGPWGAWQPYTLTNYDVEGIIASKNDASSTKWEDVRNYITVAARNVGKS